MHIERRRSRLHRRQAVMIVLRMKALDMADRRNLTGHVEPVLAPTDGVFIRDRPSICPGNEPHPVRTQHVQFQRYGHVGHHRLKISIPRQQKLAIKRFEQLGATLRSVRTTHQRHHGMLVIAALAVLQHQWQGSRRLGDQLHCTEAHGIAGKARAGQRRRISRTPGHATGTQMRHDRPGRTCLDLRHLCRHAASQELKDHSCRSSGSGVLGAQRHPCRGPDKAPARSICSHW